MEASGAERGQTATGNDGASLAQGRPMSSFRGRADEPFSLSRAVDCMRDAARAAGRPGFIWLAGIFYPSLTLGLSLSVEGDRPLDFLNVRVPGPEPEGLIVAALVGGSLFALVLLPVFARLMAGLARVAPPETWERASAGRRSPGLRRVWRAGRGLTLSAGGLWVLLGGLQYLVALLVVGLVAGVSALMVELGGTFAGVLSVALLAGPGLALVAGYALALSLLHLLALPSLVHNRRGVASALVHAWRIVRHDPIAAARAAAVDLVVYLCVALTTALLDDLDSVGAVFLALALGGFAGVTRAGFWARAYRALGGLSADDRVPGLAPASTGPPSTASAPEPAEGGERW